MNVFRNVSAGLAYASVGCASIATFDALRGAFDGTSAAAIVCACFMGGFAAAGLLMTRGGDR